MIGKIRLWKSLGDKPLSWVLPGLIGLATAALYIHTLAPGTVYFQDAGEFQAKLFTLELVHPTGYPYYQLLGKIWVSLLPIGSVAWRVNLLSACFSVITIISLARILQRIRVPIWATVSACGLLAFSPVFWEHSIMASVYTMHVALVALTTLALLHWQVDDGSPLWFGLASGLGLAHHRTFLFNLPAFGLALLLNERARHKLWSQWARLGFLAVMTVLVSYLWLIRLGVWPLERLIHFLFVQGQEFVRYAPTFSAWAQHLYQAITLRIISPFGMVPTVLGFAGLVLVFHSDSSYARRRFSIAMLSLGVVTLATYSYIWVAPDEYRYFLQLDFVLAAGWGLLLDWVGRQLLSSSTDRRWAVITAHLLVVAGALSLPVFLYRVHVEKLTKLRDGYADRVSREILATVEQDAVIIGDWILGWPIRYYHSVEGLRKDVDVIIHGERTTAIELLEAGTPLYFRQPMFGLDWDTSPYHWAQLDIGTLYRASAEAPPITHTESVNFTFENDSVVRAVVGFSAWPLRPDAYTRIRLSWDGPIAWQSPVRVELRLVDHAGDTHWRHRTLVAASDNTDIYWVTPPTLLPGEYTLSLALDVAGHSIPAQARVPHIPVGQSDGLDPARLVPDHRVDPPLAIPAVDPDLRLLGYSHNLENGEMWIGRGTYLSLYWQVTETPSAPYEPRFLLQRGQKSQPVDAACSIPTPYSGALTLSRCWLTVPLSGETGRYVLALRVVDEDSPLLKVRVRDRPRLYRVPRLQNALRVQVGEDIQLLGYDFSRNALRSGDELVVTLYWRANRQPREDYKVFTHLIGPDSNLISQHDSPMAEGAIPTSQLLRNEIVVDHHPIPVPAFLVEGHYQVYVGLYRAEDGQRLSAVGEDGIRYPNDAIPLAPISLRKR